MPDSPHGRWLKALDALFADYHGPAFAIRLWDGWTWRPSREETPGCTIQIRHPRALHTLLAEGSQVALGEAFIHNEIDVEGDLFSVFEPAEHLLLHPAPLRERLLQAVARGALELGTTLLHGRRHSQDRDRDSIAYHYDQPIEFFRPWLGRTLVYSCAYCEHPDDALDDAQDQKLELICRKLRLLYMAGCAAAFRRGDIGLYQTLLSAPERGRSGLPLTRRDWYEDRSREAGGQQASADLMMQ